MALSLHNDNQGRLVGNLYAHLEVKPVFAGVICVPFWCIRAGNGIGGNDD